MHLYVVDITVFKNKCPVLDYFSRTECLQRINLQRSSSHWTHDSFQPAVMAVISQFCLPASHVRLCNPMGCSAPGLPVHHQLLEFTQTPSSGWWSLLVLCSLLGPPAVKQLMQIVTMAPGQGRRFQSVCFP